MKWLRRLALVVVAWVLCVAGWIWIGPAEDQAAKADVAIVLGAAVTGDTPSPVFRERINHAIELHRDGRVKMVLFTGGRANAEVLSESAVAKDYAMQACIPEQDIVIEELSRTTRGNLMEARSAMDAVEMESALIVSDPLHLRRAMAIAGQLEIEAQPSATPTTRYQSLSTQLPFLLRETYFMHHFWVFGE